MSLDTRAKRASSIRFLLPFIPVLPIADGSIDEADRRLMLWSYAWGIVEEGSLVDMWQSGFNVGRHVIHKDMKSTPNWRLAKMRVRH